jgi:competence protein ComEC
MFRAPRLFRRRLGYRLRSASRAVLAFALLLSSASSFLNAIAPRVAIMDNGAKKGGTPSAWDTIKKSPRLEDLWQLHFSEEGGAGHNVAPEFIANPDGPDAANYLELTAWPDGSFEVFNSRTKQTKDYPAH